MIIDLLMAALGMGVLTGVFLVLRGGVENALIGLNIATICAVTVLIVLDRNYGLAFSKDIGYFLVFPGVFGIIVMSRFIFGGKK